MEFAGKMQLMIILKVTKNQGFSLSLKDIFQKTTGRGRVNLTPSRFRVKIK